MFAILSALIAGIVALVASVFFLSGDPDRTVVIDDVTRPQSFALTDKALHPVNMRLRIVGHIDGHATIDAPICVIDDCTEYFDTGLQQLPSGDIDLEATQDYYSSSAEIRYLPTDVRGGHLEITYNIQ
jgi:hypothetical protein